MQMRAAYSVSLVLSVSLTLIYLFQERYIDFILVFSKAFPSFIAGAAVIASAFALKRYWGNLGDQFSLIWLCLTLGMAFWFLGALSWTVLTLLFDSKMPSPSIADVAWLLGYVPLIVGGHLYIRVFRFSISKAMYAVAVLVLSVTSFAIFAFLVSSVLVTAMEEGMTVVLADIAYFALDLALFSLSILGLLIFVKGRIGRVWLLINGAILLNVLSDMLFSYVLLQGIYYSGHFLELLYYWSYILLILAFYTHRKEL